MRLLAVLAGAPLLGLASAALDCSLRYQYDLDLETEEALYQLFVVSNNDSALLGRTANEEFHKRVEIPTPELGADSVVVRGQVDKPNPQGTLVHGGFILDLAEAYDCIQSEGRAYCSADFECTIA